MIRRRGRAQASAPGSIALRTAPPGVCDREALEAAAIVTDMAACAAKLQEVCMLMLAYGEPEP